MANIRAQVVFQAFTQLPEDRYVNTFHFSNGQSFGLHIGGVEDTLDAFYQNVAVDTDALHESLSPVLARTYEYRLYNLADIEPRVPTIIPKSMGSAAAASGHPEELCACVSFEGAPPVTARRRGRIYFGPLANLNTISTSDGDTFTAIHPNLLTKLQSAANAALSASLSTLSGWAIRSSVPAENFVTIQGGFVDNAIDIQRRRGAPATGRTLWPL